MKVSVLLTILLLASCTGQGPAHAAGAITPGVTIEIGAGGDDISNIPITVQVVQLRIRPDRYGWASSLLLADAKLAQLAQLEIKAVVSVDGFPENASYTHSSPIFWSTPSDLAEVVRFADELSARYAQDPTVIAYQLMSEPVNLGGGAHYPVAMDQLNLDVIDAIRRNTATQDVIIAQAVWGFCQDHTVVNRANVVYGCHYYSPHFMTHQGINGNPSNVPWPTSFNGKAWDRDRLVQTLAVTRKFERDNQVKVYIGEFGCLRWGPNCDQYLYDLTRIFDTYEWPYMYFQINGWNGWNPSYSDVLSSDPANDYVGYGSKRWQTLINIYNK